MSNTGLLGAAAGQTCAAAPKPCSACGKTPCVCLLRRPAASIAQLAARPEPEPCSTCGKGGELVKASLSAWTAGTVLLPHFNGAEAIDAMGWWRNCRDCQSTYVLTPHAAQARVEMEAVA